jgi:hypothetical protein
VCLLATTSAAHQKAWAVPAHEITAVIHAGPRVAARIALCLYLGDELGPDERNELGLDHRKHWYECKRGKGIVCPCGTCNTCDLYAPETSV